MRFPKCLLQYLKSYAISNFQLVKKGKLMKKFRRQGKFLCIAIVGMLVFGDCATCTVYAAQSQSSNGSFAETSDDVSAEPTEGTETTSVTDAVGTAQLTDAQLAEYFGDSVFIGDSIMVGFRNYSAKKNTFVHDIEFLAAVSYSANNALKPVNGKNPHPKYQGKQYHLWDALPLMGKKRAFILLGMNDLIVMGLGDSRDKYKELIDKILETSPDMEIHIISVTYKLPEAEVKGCLDNPNIDIYNTLLQEMADENGWGYIDLCTPISDGKGGLAKECCSDNFVHLTGTAYTKWEAELIKYAAKQME